MGERGRYVVVEGIDGAGKTELAHRLVAPLLHRGHAVSSFREPTDAFLRSEAAKRIRTDPLAAALCFTVDRTMVRPEVARSLARGDVVLQDRSFYSNLTYPAPGLDEETWRELERVERTLAIEPDVVLYLDVPVEIALARLRARGGRDAFEEETFLRAVRERFERLFRPPRWVRVDATGTPEETLERALGALLAAGL